MRHINNIILCLRKKTMHTIESIYKAVCDEISKQQNKICIYPYDNNGKALSEDVIKNNYPLLYFYLNDVKDKLLNRDYDGE